MVRRGLRLLFCSQDDLRVCGDAADAETAFKGIASLKPDLAVIDLSLRGSNGLDLIRRLRAAYPKLRMLVFSMHKATLYAEPARQAGADGYLTKGEGVDRLLGRIRELFVPGAQGQVQPPARRKA